MTDASSNIAAEPQTHACHGCGHDLGIRKWCLFCPDCGLRVHADPGRRHQMIALGESILRWGKWVLLGERPRVIDLTYNRPTRILIGYGNAMFKLGWRYERGQGNYRNVPEAMRCYRKSARLGNLDAKVRLAAGQQEGRSGSGGQGGSVGPH